MKDSIITYIFFPQVITDQLYQTGELFGEVHFMVCVKEETLDF